MSRPACLPSWTMVALLPAMLWAATAAAEPLFDGRTFTGWEGDTTATWRIDDLQVVPEPPAFVLVAAGLGTLTYLARGRRGGRRSTRQDPPAAG